MGQTVITAKWTASELELMDILMRSTGAQNRSHLLRIAVLTLAEEQEAPAVVVQRACQSRVDHPYRMTARALRTLSRATVPPAPPIPKVRPRRRA